MATFPPWIQAPDVLKIIESGARTGIAARAQAANEAEAADRLSLAYAQLASEEARKGEEMQMRMEEARARRAEERLKAASLDEYRRAQTTDRRTATALRLADQARMAQQFKQSQEGIADRFNVAQENMNKRFEANALLRAADEKRKMDYAAQRDREFRDREERIRQASMNPSDRLLASADLSDLREVRKQIGEIDAAGGPKWRWIPPSRKQFRQYETLKKKESDIVERLKNYPTMGEGTSPAAAAAAGPTTPPASLPRVTTKAEFDKLPPGATYIGKNGKLYTKP